VTTHKSFCRVCHHSCAIVVESDDGSAVSIRGDRSDPVYQGYTCVKGRAQPELLRSPDRLLRPLKQSPGGTFSPVRLADATSEIARRLTEILAESGPRAIATYRGTASLTAEAPTGLVLDAFMDAVGSAMRFTPNTIDKPGKPIAKAMLGRWMAPRHSWTDADVGLFIGLNPLVSYQGIPWGHPGRKLRDANSRGLKLIVVDPRRTEIARRANLHIQPRPGHDAAILASMLKVVIEGGMYDRSFVANEVRGMAELRDAVSGFEPQQVALHAGVDAEEIELAARTFGQGNRGFAIPGVGPIMSEPGPLVDYLALCLDTICGHWLRAGELVKNPGILVQAPTPVAQAAPQSPGYGFGESMRVRGLSRSVAGMPTAALADEILLAGEGRVRALISLGGNPAATWPDQATTIRALRSLDLFVQVDPWMSQSSRLADYVIPPKMPLEEPSITHLNECCIFLDRGMGTEEPYGRYTPAVSAPPPDSELIEEWELLYEVGKRMGLPLSIRPATQASNDTSINPTTDELLDLLTAGARVPLDELRAVSEGRVFELPPSVVAPKQPGWEHKLDVANVDMIADLSKVAARVSAPCIEDDPADLRLICRRMPHVMNSAHNHPATNRGRSYNPAFMHPHELRRLDLQPGDHVEIASPHAAVVAVVDADPSLRPGLVSMAHAFGALADEDEDEVERLGSNTSRLLSNDDHFDRYAGQPQMSNVPVRLTRIDRCD
jgi:anaerobic selenocysteine-containing dehydrogenase